MTSDRIIVIAADISSDGTRRRGLARCADGFFVYSEDTFMSEDLREFGAGTEEYWSPTHVSGLFGTEDEARADALGQLPWLKQLDSPG